MIPREPTTAMMLAGIDVQDRENGQDTAGVWRAMFDAAPIPTNSELAQAYQQGYQDGRKSVFVRVATVANSQGGGGDTPFFIAQIVHELGTALRRVCDDYQDLRIAYFGDRNKDGDCPALQAARAALAKVAQPQPATKGE